jgi:hypothetical protein
MADFRVTGMGFFDGVHRHKPGTIIRILPKDYDRLLSLSFEPVDAAAKDALERARARFKAKNGVDYTPPPEIVAGTLDPHKQRELEEMAQGAVVVQEAPGTIKPLPRVEIPETATK